MMGTMKEAEHDNGSTHEGDSQHEAVVKHVNDRLLSSDFVLATLANFANALCWNILMATVPVYVISLGGNQAEAGAVIGAASMTALLFRPCVGWLTDAWRRLPLVRIGSACYGLASVVYLLAGSIPFLLLGRLVHGLGASCYGTASNTYVADIAPPGRRAEAIGFFSAAEAVGLVVGPVFGFLLIGTLGFKYLFYFTGGMGFTALFILLFARERRQPGKIKPQPWSPRSGIVAVEALPVAWIALCMGVSLGTVAAFIAIFARTRGVTNPGFFFAVQAAALLISRTIAGYFADRYGRTAAIVPGIILMAIALAVLPLAQGIPFFVITAALFGLGFGTAQPANMALLIDRVPLERRGLASSTYYIGFDVGLSIGAILMGLVSQHWGFGVMWSLAATFTLLGLLGPLADWRHVASASR
jgi:MFS family permease